MSRLDFLSGFVAIVGPANAGKSTLLNKIIGEKIAIVSNKPHTTRNRIIGVKNDPKGQIVFIDTPGLAYNIRRGELKRYLIESRRSACSGVDCVALVVDSGGFVSDQGVKALSYIIDDVDQKKIDVLVLNKVDRLKPQTVLPMIARIGSLFKEMSISQIPEIVPVSAISGSGVDEFVNTVWGLLPKGDAFYPADIRTDQAEEFYISEIIREKLFERMRQEIPYSVAVRVDEVQDSHKMMNISATVFVERSNQKSIVIGSKGRALKAVGIAAREELEKIYGVHINLQLYVKVEEDWSRSVNGLRKVGYKIGE